MARFVTNRQIALGARHHDCYTGNATLKKANPP
jgi:hypothetical protein